MSSESHVESIPEMPMRTVSVIYGKIIFFVYVITAIYIHGEYVLTNWSPDPFY